MKLMMMKMMMTMTIVIIMMMMMTISRRLHLSGNLQLVNNLCRLYSLTLDSMMILIDENDCDDNDDNYDCDNVDDDVDNDDNDDNENDDDDEYETFASEWESAAGKQFMPSLTPDALLITMMMMVKMMIMH